MLNGNEDVFEGVILAAGQGTRMSPFSDRYPKPLLPVLNKPLIHIQIEYLKSLGVRKIFVVIGHLGHEIALDLRRGKDLGVDIEYVEQRKSLGIAHALVQLEQHVTKPFVLLLGDIYFEVVEAANPIRQMSDRKASGILAVMPESDPAVIRRNFAVHMDETGLVSRVVEKPRFPRTQWKGCGIYIFDVAFFDALRRTSRSAARNEYEVTDSIQTFIDDGATVIAQEMISCDINMTFPYDVLLANLHGLRTYNMDNLISPEAKVHPGATLEHCVVGSGVVIDTPVTLKKTLIFPNTTVKSSMPFDRAVITPDRIVDCRHWIGEDGQALSDKGTS